VQDRCRAERPELEGKPHPAACFFPEGGDASGSV
jgi:dipeptide transport system ATP-binding protein